MAVHTLVTGVPGAGKTLYTLHELVRPMVGTEIEYEGAPVQRRIIVGNVRDLVLEHVPMTIPDVNPETFKEPHPDLERQPGQPPLDVECSVISWWLWCQPGDVIVVDECQRAFRPFASGRRIPLFIAKLETARHYGVEFIFVTQHPQLLHLNVRNLVGRYLHVRRLFAGMQTVVYEWDHCTHPDRTRNATATPWRHKSAAYGLYKSAEVHTKGKARVPFALFALVAAVVVLPVGAWYAKTRIFDKEVPKAGAAPGGTLPPGEVQTAAPGPVSVAVFVPDRGQPGFADALPPRKTWPHNLAGCWEQAGECKCAVDDGAYRVVSDRPALCWAVVSGDLVPPATHPKPVRLEPVPTGQERAGQGGEPASHRDPGAAPPAGA